mmetsp:Transcript_33867/g.34505  ORF Transcript_33867/g.34505 Transcript_33867/m.34505 type:complete len:162 (-) Transcript_33867:205-690(-)
MSKAMSQTWKMNDIPTNRSYLINHDKTKFYDFHSDDSHIAPTWTKISTSPWDGRSKLAGGYGKKLETGIISDDCPTYFFNPHRVTSPEHLRKKNSRVDNTNSVGLLPGPSARTMTAAASRKPSHKSVPYTNQVIMVPLPTRRVSREIAVKAKSAPRPSTCL